MTSRLKLLFLKRVMAYLSRLTLFFLPANSCRLDSIYPFKGESFDISVTIEDFKFPALIDTGAAVTTISSKFGTCILVIKIVV